GSEARNQRNLLVRKWANLLAIDGDSADRLALFDHRHCNQCPGAEDLDGTNRYGIAVDIGLLGAHVSDVDRLQCRGSTDEWEPRAGTEQRSTSFHETWRLRAVSRGHAKSVSLSEPQIGMSGLA